MTFKLEIITPRGIYLTEDVSSLTIKLTSGYRTFLPGHYPLIGSLDYAPMHTIKNGEINYYAIHGGAINVTREKTVLICNAIEHAKDIDAVRAKYAHERAKNRLSKKDPNIDVKRAQLALARALARLKTIELK